MYLWSSSSGSLTASASLLVNAVDAGHRRIRTSSTTSSIPPLKKKTITKCQAVGKSSSSSQSNSKSEVVYYQGVYGPWTIQPSDVQEVFSSCSFLQSLFLLVVTPYLLCFFQQHTDNIAQCQNIQLSCSLCAFPAFLALISYIIIGLYFKFATIFLSSPAFSLALHSLLCWDIWAFSNFFPPLPIINWLLYRVEFLDLSLQSLHALRDVTEMNNYNFRSVITQFPVLRF